MTRIDATETPAVRDGASFNALGPSGRAPSEVILKRLTGRLMASTRPALGPIAFDLAGPNPTTSLDAARLPGAREARSAAEQLIWLETCERRGRLFVDVVAPRPRLILFGAVPIAAALCQLGRAIGWRCYVVDPRTPFATKDTFPQAERVIAAWPEEAFAELGGIDPATSIAVLTHDPKLDDAALEIALRSPARFVGAMGSRVAQAARRRGSSRSAFLTRS